LPITDIVLHGEPTLLQRMAITLAAAAALLSCAGCIVTSATYDGKAREVDVLRDAYASLNREKTRMAGEVEALSKEVAREKAAGEALAGQLREKEESLKRLSGELEAVRKASEGSRLTREQFIDELLAKEKATGKRLQELSSRADACSEELARERRESTDRDREVAELRKKLETKEEPTGR
jgi:septal ring factor EnvC (AmiA/AmiB activator)